MTPAPLMPPLSPETTCLSCHRHLADLKDDYITRLRHERSVLIGNLEKASRVMGHLNARIEALQAQLETRA